MRVQRRRRARTPGSRCHRRRPDGSPLGAACGRGGRRNQLRGLRSAASSSRSRRRRTPTAVSSASDIDWPLSAARSSGLDSTSLSARRNAGLRTTWSAMSTVSRLSSASASSRFSAGLSRAWFTTRSVRSVSRSETAARSRSALSSTSATTRSTTRCSISDRATASGSGAREDTLDHLLRLGRREHLSGRRLEPPARLDLARRPVSARPSVRPRNGSASGERATTRVGRSASRAVVAPIRPVLTARPTTTFRPFLARATQPAWQTLARTANRASSLRQTAANHNGGRATR